MSSVPSKLLLLPSLLLMGWGMSAWLEEGTAWTSTDNESQATNDENVDIRVLIGNQSNDESNSDHQPHRAGETGMIELVSGETARDSSQVVPAWLTGEIE